MQRAHGTNIPPNGSCSEPIERIFVTVSVLIRRVHNGGKDDRSEWQSHHLIVIERQSVAKNTEIHYTKRDCDTISRSINNSTWMELDVVEVIRHWQKTNRSIRHGNRPDLMLTIDVHDHDRNELNANQFFVPMDCQAGACVVFRFLVLFANKMYQQQTSNYPFDCSRKIPNRKRVFCQYDSADREFHQIRSSSVYSHTLN